MEMICRLAFQGWCSEPRDMTRYQSMRYVCLIHTYIHTYIHTCMHAYIHTYIGLHTYLFSPVFRPPVPYNRKERSHSASDALIDVLICLQ